MDKREKTERQRQEDAALHKILYWMGGAAILVALLRLTQNYYIDFLPTQEAKLLAWNIGRALPWICLAGAVLAIAAFYWAFRGAKLGKTRVFPWALGSFFTGFTVCALGVWRFAGVGIQLLGYVVIGMGILAVIYYLYQRDFVMVALDCGLGMLGLWLFFREGATTRLYIVFGGLLVLLAAMAVFARYLQARGGVLAIKDRRLEVLPKGTSYALIYITCGLIALMLAGALILGGTLSGMAYYAVPVAWGLIMAVYYTVKLM